MKVLSGSVFPGGSGGRAILYLFHHLLADMFLDL